MRAARECGISGPRWHFCSTTHQLGEDARSVDQNRAEDPSRPKSATWCVAEEPLTDVIANEGTTPAPKGEDEARLAELRQLHHELAVRFGRTRLTIELVPKTSWCSNVRSHVSETEWDRLRKPVYERTGSRCDLCGGRGPAHPVECHEIWQYDDEASVQRLVGLIALCPACHGVKHLGRSHVKGRGDEAIDQLMKINQWSATQADAYIELVLDIWKLRSRVPWRLDLSWLAEQGISIPGR